MAFYRSIKDTTIQVEAVKHDGTKTAFNNIRSLISVTGETNLAVIKSGRVYIKTREGSFIVPKGFYVVKDSYGDIIVSSPLDFTSIYETGTAMASASAESTGQSATIVNVIGGSEQISGTLYVDYINNYNTGQGINIEGITFVNNSINVPGIVVVGAATPVPSTMITLQNNISYTTALTVLSAAAEPIFTVLDNGGITFSSGATVNTIEINLTNDDTHLPTSGAVVDYVTAFGYVDTSGAPANNQVAVFTDGNTIEGDTGLTYDSGTGILEIDIINESTADAGVTIETAILKDGDIIPGADTTYDLGTTAIRWNYLYADNISIPDNTKIYCGNDNDLEVYHTGGHSYIDSILAGAEIRIRGVDAGSNTRSMIIGDPDDSVELYYGGAKKFETATGGATITGELAVDNIAISDDGWVYWGAANELGIRNTGGTNFITSTDHGAPLLIRGEDGAGALKTLILADPDNSVGLYYNGTQKIITTATGCTLSGIVAVTGDIALTERADHASTPADGQGYLWVRNDAPNVLIFTDDTGADTVLSSGAGTVDTAGVPADNQIAVFTDADTIEGDTGLTYDSGTGYLDVEYIVRAVGSLEHLTIKAGNASGGAGTDAGNLYLTAGDALAADAASQCGHVYISPGCPYATNDSGYVYLGNSDYDANYIYLAAAGNPANVVIRIEPKGTAPLYLGDSGGNNTTICTGDLALDVDLEFVSSHDGIILGATGIPAHHDGYDITMVGGTAYATSGDNGGNVLIYGGAPDGAGDRGNVYIGDGAANAYLPAKTTETNVVYYDTTTGKLSYGAP